MANTLKLTETQSQTQEKWTKVIEPKTSLFTIRLYEIWQYRDLIIMFVRRDFVSNYKQTILGPIWFFLQPLLTAFIYIVIFGNIANISTDGQPMILFYLSGITLWNYFSDNFNKTATVFKDNASLFGKVYFPRLTMPISIVLSNLVRLGIQLLLFLGFWLYFLTDNNRIQPNWYILLTPVLILMMALISLGSGLIICSVTNKYRDLVFLISFGVQLLMYATPVIYPMSTVPEKYKWLIQYNPLSAIVETFRYSFLGTGAFSWGQFFYSFCCSIFILILGILVFNKVEKSFTDTI
jgi:lipopolysaccharide transport system permease protein